jgi:DnaA family protein
VRQLPLGVTLRLAARFETFVAGDNATCVAALEAQGAGPALPALWLTGGPGAGKTHLLQALCARAGERGRRAAYVPVASFLELGPDALEGFETLDLACFDDVERVLGDARWEHRLFSLFNGLTEHGSIVFAAGEPPGALAIGLADLASRLRAAAVFRLSPLSEAAQAEALQARANHRGLELPAESLQYLLRRAPRDFPTLCRILDELDVAQLAAQRRLTIPLVRETLERHGL